MHYLTSQVAKNSLANGKSLPTKVTIGRHEEMLISTDYCRLIKKIVIWFLNDVNIAAF